MLNLKLLGGASLQDEDGVLSGPATHRPSLALLAVLARSPERATSRERLVGLLWPDSPEATGRNRLSTYVHRIRKALGEDVVLSSNLGLRLNTHLVGCDVHRFQSALERGDPEAAVELYGGPFLDGFWLPESGGFERWVEGERDRLRRTYQQALEIVAEKAERRGEPGVAARHWRERLRDDPLDSSVVLRLMKALDAAGNRAAALRAFQRHAEQMENELGMAPGGETAALARRLREQPMHTPDAGGPPDPEEKPSSRAVAVLPFEHIGDSAEAVRFAAGIHYDLLTRLAGIEDLQVISRTSVLRYQGTATPTEQIARELAVGTIVEGGVQHANGRVRLNVQLIDARGDAHRWAQTYDHQVTPQNLFDVQAKLAEDIAESLRAQLAGAERARVVRPSAEDLEAYLLYVQGRTHLARRTERGIRSALDYFQRALEREPDHAAALAGAAEALALLRWYGYPLPAGAPDPMEAVRRSLDLDPALPDAYTSLGIVHGERLEGPSAKSAFERATELGHSHAEPHTWLGWIHVMLGTPREGLPPARRAASLDPMAPYTSTFLAQVLLAVGDPEAALNEAVKARSLQPEFEIPHYIEGLALHHLERPREAAFAFEEDLRLVHPRGTPSRAQVQAMLAVSHAAAGAEASARRLLAELKESGDAAAVGVVHAALGESEEAFAAFGNVRRWGPFATPLVRYHLPDVLDPLRDDPRFTSLLEDVNRSWGLEPTGT